MEIKTKFEIWDWVYRMEKNKVKKVYIDEISIKVDYNVYRIKEVEIHYWFEDHGIMYTEENIFWTREELLETV